MRSDTDAGLGDLGVQSICSGVEVRAPRLHGLSFSEGKLMLLQTKTLRNCALQILWLNHIQVIEPGVHIHLAIVDF